LQLRDCHFSQSVDYSFAIITFLALAFNS